MSFRLRWSPPAEQTYKQLQEAAERAANKRLQSKAKQSGGKSRTKSSKQEGLFKQVAKAIERIGNDPRHPSLNTHEFTGLPNPFDPQGKVFEAYAQNNTPGAYRIFWCYGPEKGEITIIAITPHP
jgi:hypothetical protein